MTYSPWKKQASIKNQIHELKYFFSTDDPVGLFATELIPMQRESEVCSGVEGGTSLLEAFQVRLAIYRILWACQLLASLGANNKPH